MGQTTYSTIQHYYCNTFETVIGSESRFKPINNFNNIQRYSLSDKNMYKSLRDALCGTHTVYVGGKGLAPCVTWIHKPYASQWFPPTHGSLQVYPPMCSLNLGKRIRYPIIASANKNTSQKKKKKNINW